MQIFKETHINFVDKRKIAFLLSLTAVIIGIGSLIVQGGPKYGVDFTGGTSIQLKFEKSITAGELRSALGTVGLADAEIKRIGLETDNEFIIRVEQQAEGAELSQTIEQALSSQLPDNPFDVRSVVEIGPKIGGELRRAAILAVLISMLGLLVYISWRFEFKFAVGAIVALFHDVLITLGVFSVLGFEITLSVIAAFLTIVGYSLNDTIVVYDRIRENLKVLRRESFPRLINVSINQTLSRTIITSFTTLVVVVVLFIFGGEVIHQFAFALIVGIFVGTYSSIFVASPIVLEWRLRSEARRGQKRQMLRGR
jgi:preprotein translocase subunit SecF